MNQLNSILLEGIVTNKPVIVEKKELTFCSCHFPVESKRTVTKSGVKEEMKSSFIVQAWGNVADICRERIKPGTGLRIVGRIQSKQKQDFDYLPESYIIAEHIEIKPSNGN